MKIASFLILFVSAFAHANVSDFETQKLVSVRSSRELSKAMKSSKELRLAEASCEAQRKVGHPPIACIDATRIEMSLGLIDSQRAKILLDGYSAQCEERAFTTASIQILDAALNKQSLPARCRKSLSQRREELLYIMSSRGESESRSGI